MEKTKDFKDVSLSIMKRLKIQNFDMCVCVFQKFYKKHKTDLGSKGEFVIYYKSSNDY